jgi:LmbE family N-acetylglucosaminyl deacetylase
MDSQEKKVLAIGAHPDDVEIMCSGTLFLLWKLGYEIHVATMTLGDCGSTEHPPQVIRRIRKREAQAACEVLGATYHYAGFNDFCIYNDDQSNRRTVALLRDIDPQLVLTHSPQDYIADHETTSLLVRNACFYAPAPNYDTLSFTQAEYSSAIPYLFYAHPVEGVDIFGKKIIPQFYVDVTDCIWLKTKMLACHESQRNWLRAHHGMDEYIESVLGWNASLGEMASKASSRSIGYAEAFRQHLGHAYPHTNILAELLKERIIQEPAY